MRDIQPEILRGIEAFARGNQARLHRLEVADSAIKTADEATNERITALEERVPRLETRRSA